MDRVPFSVESLGKWFRPENLQTVLNVISALPLEAIEKFTSGERHFPPVSFEAVSSMRIVCSVLRILARILGFGSCRMISRASLELTHRCVSDCEYCRTKDPQTPKINETDKTSVSSLVKQLSLFGCKFLHLTGGEVSLLSWVPEIISEATGLGMETTLSSNGGGSRLFYNELVKSGLRSIHLSFDTCDKREYEAITRNRLQWDNVVSNLSFLCGPAKKINPGFVVIANIVLNDRTLPRLPETVNYLMNIGVDDIKLIPTMGCGMEIGHLKEMYSSAILPAILQYIASSHGYPMLRYRAIRLFDEGTHGVRKQDRESTKLVGCELSMDNIDVRADGVFAPCFIYMREKYTEKSYALGSLAEGVAEYFEKAETKLRSIYQCDKICQLYCPDFIRAGNMQIADIVTECISIALRQIEERADLVGEISFTYKDIEVPSTSSILSNDGSQKILLIPRIYAENLPTIRRVLCESGVAFLEPMNVFRHPDFPTGLGAIQIKVLHRFVSNHGGYITYKVSSGNDALTAGMLKLSATIPKRSIDAVLRNGEVAFSRFRIGVTPILVCNMF